MGYFYVTLPSDSSSLYFAANTIGNFTTKLATPLELQHDKCEIGLVEISYPNGYKKRIKHNTIYLDSQEIIFPVKDYESMLDLLRNIPYLLEASKKRKFYAHI
jgi:hypothetical protein